MKHKKQIIGIIVFIILIAVIIGIKFFNDYRNTSNGQNDEGLTTVYVATGGGKEDFIADEDVVKIMREKKAEK